VLIDDTFNLEKYFTHKDKQTTFRRLNVVYKIDSNCGESYTGKTLRNLATN